MKRTADPETPNELARYEAQKLAFAPLVFQGARAMRDLGVLASLYRAADAGKTPDEVEHELGLGHYATRVLLEAGYAAGLCIYDEPRFTITKTGVYFLTDRLTRVNTDFSHHVCYAPAKHLTESLREGLPVGLRELGPWPTVYEGLRELSPDVKKAWFDFDHHYSDGVFETCLTTVLATRPKHLVDIGGNTGRFAKTCLSAPGSPERLTLVDLPGQVAMARRAIDDPRVSFHEGDVRAESTRLPEGADVYWMSQFLDCFSEAEIKVILAKVRAAVPKDGRVYVLETFWNRQRYEAARFCVIATTLYFACVANGNSRMYHSADLERLLHEAGFRVETSLHGIGLAHSLLECRPV